MEVVVVCFNTLSLQALQDSPQKLVLVKNCEQERCEYKAGMSDIPQ
jgi:hypothetical protein